MNLDFEPGLLDLVLNLRGYKLFPYILFIRRVKMIKLKMMFLGS
jgi:hypothetical protein